MGLDMYLSRKTYVKQWDHIAPEQQFLVTVTKGGKPYSAIDPKKVSFVTEQVAYWRKANQIHQWFVKNCQDGVDECQHSYVSREQLHELVDVCRKVLLARGTPEQDEVISELLPPQEGFFFGSTEIDDYYFEDIESTIRQIEPLLKEDGEEISGDYEYHSSW